MFAETVTGKTVYIKKHLESLKEYLVISSNGYEKFIDEHKLAGEIELSDKEEGVFFKKYLDNTIYSHHQHILENYILYGNLLYKRWGVNPEMEIELKNEIDREEVLI